MWTPIKDSRAMGVHTLLPNFISVQTTERYLGCKQRLKGAVNDRIGIEPEKECISAQ
jgi:hypothetical protein